MSVKMTYSIYEARAKFSELVRTTLTAGSVLITQRGVPVIRLVPYAASPNTMEERLCELERVGKARRATSAWPREQKAIPHACSTAGVVARFLSDRDG